PGKSQYVCQCGSCTSRRATVIDFPGCTEVSAATSDAFTCGVIAATARNAVSDSKPITSAMDRRRETMGGKSGRVSCEAQTRRFVPERPQAPLHVRNKPFGIASGRGERATVQDLQTYTAFPNSRPGLLQGLPCSRFATMNLLQRATAWCVAVIGA